MKRKSEIRLNGERAMSRAAVARLRKLLLLARKRTNLPEGTLNISFVSDPEIIELNLRYLKRSGTTDVMSFPMAEVDPESGEILLGDIAVSLDTAKRVAAEKDHSWEAEAALYALHGLLHLAGYDDDIPARRKKMWNLQLELLREVGWIIS